MQAPNKGYPETGFRDISEARRWSYNSFMGTNTPHLSTINCFRLCYLFLTTTILTNKGGTTKTSFFILSLTILHLLFLIYQYILDRK